MSRCNTYDVQSLMTYLPDDMIDDYRDIQVFIDTADVLIDNYLEGSGLSESTLKQISIWLSAHLLACKVRQPSREEITGADVTYGGTFGKGLNFTQYGQQVIALDTTGRLANAWREDKFKIIFEIIQPTS